MEMVLAAVECAVFLRPRSDCGGDKDCHSIDLLRDGLKPCDKDHYYRRALFIHLSIMGRKPQD